MSRRALAFPAFLVCALLPACAERDPACADYDSYRRFGAGTSVTVFTSILPPEQEKFEEAWSQFETCTGIDVVYEGSDQFEAQLGPRVAAGNAPDIAFIPQPGLLRELADEGTMVAVPAAVEANVAQNWNAGWTDYGSVDGTLYGASLGANLKSLVWYSPTTFTAHSYTVPTTWDEMVTLSDQMVVDGIKPWCGGIESGGATGWAATDWLEQVVLREHGGDVYDQWVAHDVVFDSTQIRSSLETLDQWMRNPDWVNGGFGDSTTIATTFFFDAGGPVLAGDCGMLQQASFYAAAWSQFESDVAIAEDGDVFAFYLPADGGTSKPEIGGGEFVIAFADRPEVVAFQTFLSSGTFATLKVEGGDWVSANAEVPLDSYQDPISRLSAEILVDPDATFRFDASDMMPPEVGTGSFWEEMTKFFAENQSIDATVQAIDASWPAR